VAEGKLKALVNDDEATLRGQILLAESYYFTRRVGEASAILFEGGLLARTKRVFGKTHLVTLRAIRVWNDCEVQLKFLKTVADSIPG
jgi:hypothetical protein